jgi:hypothetical protein
VRTGDFEVVVQDRHRCHDLVEEFLTIVPGLSSRQLNSHLKFRHGDGGDRHVVLVRDDGVKIAVRPFSIDQERGVKDQAAQNRSSAMTSSRVCLKDSDHSASAGCRFRMDFASEPWPLPMGSMWAMARPRRTMVMRSLLCSTASSNSAKFLAAFVALISVTESDYQIVGVGGPTSSFCSQVLAAARMIETGCAYVTNVLRTQTSAQETSLSNQRQPISEHRVCA